MKKLLACLCGMILLFGLVGQVLATSITITNDDFEDTTFAGTYSSGPIDSWTKHSDATSAGTIVASAFGLPSANGQAAYINARAGGTYIYQWTTEALTTNTVFTLTADVGLRTGYTTGDYYLKIKKGVQGLYSNTVDILSDTTTTVGAFETVTLTSTYLGTVAAGEVLMVELGFTSSSGQISFDNVVFEKELLGQEQQGEQSVPEPTTLLLLGTGLIGLAGISRRKFFK